MVTVAVRRAVSVKVKCYRLTPKGKSLRPVLNSVMKWGLEHLEGTEARLKPK